MTHMKTLIAFLLVSVASAFLPCSTLSHSGRATKIAAAPRSHGPVMFFGGGKTAAPAKTGVKVSEAPRVCSIFNLSKTSHKTSSCLHVVIYRFAVQVVVSQGNKVIKQIESPEATNLRKLLLANNVEVSLSLRFLKCDST
eukprot:7378-Heterococcus_DN1.PRE.3